MNADKNNLDQLLTNAISRNGLKFDFNKWKQNHKDEINIFESEIKLNTVAFANIRHISLWRKVGYLAAAFLIISSLSANFVQSQKVNSLKDELNQARREIALAPTDDSAAINFYLKEHQDTIARNASHDSNSEQPVQMFIDSNDLLYYEFFDDEPEYMNPGIIVRGPFSQNQTISTEAPIISNGHTLTLSEARQAAGFDLVLPSWLDPGYALEQILTIEDRDAMQMLYTNGINSVSLFEQPLNGQRGLSHQDFREYAVYRKNEKAGGTILAWRDNARSYVLIGNIELSQLMNMAQSINATK